MSQSDHVPRPLDAASFDALIESADRPVIVDFWATWCPPCRQLAPELDTLAADHGDELIVAKVDVDAEPRLAARFEIRSIPTMVVFDGGREVGRITGFRPAAQLAGEVTALAGNAAA